MGHVAHLDFDAAIVDEMLQRQGSDGTFPEKGGFDSKYQTVSLEHLARYASTLPDYLGAMSL